MIEHLKLYNKTNNYQILMNSIFYLNIIIKQIGRYFLKYHAGMNGCGLHIYLP